LFLPHGFVEGVNLVLILLSFGGMIIAASLFVAGIGLAFIGWQLHKAPEGYEDETGFHATETPRIQAVPRRSVRSPQPATAH
jgi:hypothetical protein